MAESNGTRSAMPHPPGGVPGYFARSPFEGAVVGKSKGFELYESLARGHFEALPEEIPDADLAFFESYHRARLDAEREERRMHFGALALVAVLFFLLLPALISQSFANLALDLIALLLLVLTVPYVFVYFGYENRVRAMAVGLFRLLDARARKAEQRRGMSGGG